jgi:hypothetical protein
MNVLRRYAVAAIVMALFLCAGAQAQVLKQIPADPIVVIKANKPQAISDKVAAVAQRLGLANARPELADPLGMLKKQLNIKDGFDGNGEMAIAIYEPAPNSPEPEAVVLIPVTDYKAFIANLTNVQQEGNLSKFQLADNPQPMYVTNWGNYAAVSQTKERLGQAPTGVSPTAACAKQLDSNDVVAWANMAKIRTLLQPQWQAMKPMALGGLDQNLANAPGLNPKFIPAIKALVNQLIVVMEAGLNDTAGATFGLNISKEGINTTFMLDFTPESYMGKALAGYKVGDQNLIVGLPNKKYFAFAGASIDSATVGKMFADFADPIAASLNQAGDEGKSIVTMINAGKATIAATNGLSMGYVQPTAPPGQQSVVQAVGVYHGDAKKIGESTKQSQAVMGDFMKMMPQNQGISFKTSIQPGAKNIDGVALDELTMKFVVDPNNPQAVQIGQMFQMMYGPNGLSGAMGAVDDKTYLFAMGADDALIGEAVASAKKQDTALAQQPNIAAVTKALPANKILVEYIALDNIADTVSKYMAQFGFPMKVKIPTDLPPVGFSVATEGPSVRFDTHISIDLIESTVSTVMQAIMMQQGGRPGQL